MNRVNTKTGKLPVIIVAPHGNDDINTDIIADVIATELDAYSVINVGWKRAKKAILGENIANLNCIRHCKLVKEFLGPLQFYKNQIIKKFKQCHVFYVHGMSNKIRRVTGENVDIVVGYGAGEPPSYTCGLGYKNALITRFQQENLCTYQGKSGGRFSAWKSENLTQLFVDSDKVQSIQLEIVNLRRYDIDTAIRTAHTMAKALDKFLHQKTVFSEDMFVKEYLNCDIERYEKGSNSWNIRIQEY